MPFLDDLKRSARQQAAPVTLGLIVALVVVAVLGLLSHFSFFEAIAVGSGVLQRPWTVLTYPFAFGLGSGLSLLFLICTVSWMLWTLGSMEREIGSLRLAFVWVVASILPIIFLSIGGKLLGSSTPPALGPLLPLAATTAIWGFRNKTGQIKMWGILPITGFWLAMLDIAIVFINYAMVHPVLGLFATFHCGVAILFAENKLPYLPYSVSAWNTRPSKGQRIKEEAYFNDVRKREQEREEKERLRKLFERSMDN